MTEKPENSKSTQPQAEPPLIVTRGWGQQMIGALIGALVMVVAMQIGPSFGWQPANRTMPFLIGGTVGALLFSLDRLALAGSRLTRRTEGLGARMLNVLIALLGMAVITGLVLALSALIGWVFKQF